MNQSASSVVDNSPNLESWAGETRVNLLRLALLLLFYGQHLTRYFLLERDPSLTPEFHSRATALVLAWGALITVVYLFMDLPRWRPWIKYATTLADVTLISAMIGVAGGPRSPLVFLLGLVIASAPLRVSLSLVYFATVASMLGYLATVAFYAWFQIGFDRYYADPTVRLARGDQALVLLTLLSTGLLSGQVTRQMRRLMARAEGDAASGVTT